MPHPSPPESEESNQEPLFLADECTFTQTVRMMRAAGCTVHRVQDLGMTGAPDAEVYQMVLDKKAVLVTTDRGFGDVRSYPPSSHHGIIVLNVSPDPGQVRAVHRTLTVLLQTETSFARTLFVVDEKKYRKRKQP